MSTDKTQDIVYDIIGIVRRGVTVIDVTGGFSGQNRKMIMCTVRMNEVALVVKNAQNRDNNAFITIAEAGEIIGNGFKK